jgi:hypothetical protein
VTSAYWEVNIAKVYGTAMMVGIGRDCNLISPVSFENLIGQDSNSYGLHHKGQIYHNHTARSYCKEFTERREVTIGVLFDGPQKQLSFYVNGEYKGVAFDNINTDFDYYPIISRLVL